MVTKKIFALALSCSSALISGIAHAQTDASSGGVVALEEVIVTAERRTSDVQRTAAAVSVRNGEDLLGEGRYSVRQILEDVPGIGYVDLGGITAGGTDTAGNNVIMRGVPSNIPLATLSPPPTTATYVDGIYEGIGGAYDIDRVEVLRGPQGTLYGRSATAGVVAIHTHNPKFDRFAADVAVEAGNYNLRHVTGGVNVPVNDKLALRLSGNHYERDGYYSKKGGALETNDGRLKLLYQPIEQVSILLGAAFRDNETHTGGKNGVAVRPGEFDYQTVPVADGENQFRQYWATVDWDLGFGVLTYQGALRSWEQDADLLIGGIFLQTVKTPKDDFVTHEIRLASDKDSRIAWQVGTIYYDNQLRNSYNNYVWSGYAGGPPFTAGSLVFERSSSRNTRDYGAFGELTFPFSDSTRVTAGLRYDFARVEVSQINFYNPAFPGVAPAQTQVLGPPQGTQEFENVTYRLRFEHDLSPRNLVYAMGSTGFLPGDVQIGAATATQAPQIQTFAEETLTAYEAGSKNRFFDDRVQLNASVYYYDYEGLQQAVAVSSVESQVFTIPANMTGLELESLFQITEDDRLSLSYSYTDSRYGDKPAAFAALVPQKRLPRVAPHTANLTYDHVFRLPGDSTLTGSVAARYFSAHVIESLTPAQLASSLNGYGWNAYATVPDTTIFDVSGTWRSAGGGYSVTAYVRNLADERYTISLGLTQRSPTTYSANGAQSEPRNVGVTVSAHF